MAHFQQPLISHQSLNHIHESLPNRFLKLSSKSSKEEIFRVPMATLKNSGKGQHIPLDVAAIGVLFYEGVGETTH